MPQLKQQPVRNWVCTGCQSTNHSKHVCNTCGMRRSWAEAAKSAQNVSEALPPGPGPKPGNPVQQQLQVIAQKLAQGTGLVPPSPPTSTSPPPSGAVLTTETMPPAAGSEEAPPIRTELVSSIKQLEAALTSIPDVPALQGARAQVQQQLDEKRKQLGDLRPIGKRLDGARAALSRSRRRLATAEESLRLAQQAVDAAKEEVQKLETDVRELETQVPTTSATHEIAASDVIANLTTQLDATIAQLASFTTVAPDAVAEAQAQSQSIIAKFKATLDQAAAAAAAAPANHGRRITTKAAPVALRIRHVGKQAPKRFTKNYFKGKTNFSRGAGNMETEE